MSFYSIYQQGFVRVAACTPKCEVADPSYNVAETLALARDGARQGVALMVFPELASAVTRLTIFSAKPRCCSG